MQVVADAEEREALLEELAHAPRTEQEDAQNDLMLVRFGDERVGGGFFIIEIVLTC